MYQPPPLRCSVFDGKKVLLIDSCQATCAPQHDLFGSPGSMTSSCSTFGDTHLGRRSNSTSRLSKPVPGSKLFFSLGPQPIFRLRGPVKSPSVKTRVDNGEKPSNASSPLLDSLSAGRNGASGWLTYPWRESTLSSTRSRLNGVKSTDTDIW